MCSTLHYPILETFYIGDSGNYFIKVSVFHYYVEHFEYASSFVNQ